MLQLFYIYIWFNLKKSFELRITWNCVVAFLLFIKNTWRKIIRIVSIQPQIEGTLEESI